MWTWVEVFFWPAQIMCILTASSNRSVEKSDCAANIWGRIHVSFCVDVRHSLGSPKPLKNVRKPRSHDHWFRCYSLYPTTPPFAHGKHVGLGALSFAQGNVRFLSVYPYRKRRFLCYSDAARRQLWVFMYFGACGSTTHTRVLHSQNAPSSPIFVRQANINIVWKWEFHKI